MLKFLLKFFFLVDRSAISDNARPLMCMLRPPVMSHYVFVLSVCLCVRACITRYNNTVRPARHRLLVCYFSRQRYYLRRQTHWRSQDF